MVEEISTERKQEVRQTHWNLGSWACQDPRGITQVDFFGFREDEVDYLFHFTNEDAESQVSLKQSSNSQVRDMCRHNKSEFTAQPSLLRRQSSGLAHGSLHPQ